MLMSINACPVKIALTTTILLAPAILALGPPAAAAEPNETFAEATVLAPGILTTGPQLLDDGGIGATFPDTTLGFFTDGTFSNLIDFDDDGGGIVGDGFGSALFEYDVLADGSVPLIVSGFADYDFDGLNDDEDQFPHDQEGSVDLILLVWEIGDLFTLFDRQEVALSLLPGSTFPHVFQDATWIGHKFTAMADNTVDGGNDVDFWRFTGLEPGTSFEAETSSTWVDQDTILGRFDDANGTLIDSNDDIDFVNTMSRINGVVPASGEVVLAVTSFDDFDFIGAHAGSDNYSLDLTISAGPTPGDFDGDDDVDGDDFLAWQAGFGTSIGATLADGDADFDGDVDGDDFLIWQSNFGSGSGEASGGPVPEPTGWLICVLVVLGWVSLGCKRDGVPVC